MAPTDLLNTVRARPRTGARVRGAAAAVLVTAVLTSCAEGAAPALAESADLPAGVTVAVTQLRSDVAARQVEVQVRNGSDAPLQIGAVAFVDPRFEAPAERVVDRTSTLGPGGTVDIRVQLPGVACGAPTESASTVTLEWTQGERAGTATAPAAEVFPFLAALHTRECVAERAADAATIELATFTPAPSGEPATLALAIEPRADAGDVVITGIRETNLLTFDGVSDGILPLEILLAGPARTVPLSLRPARCDPHAVQEDKRGTVFTVDVTIDGEAGQFTLAADADMRGRMLTWVTEWCAAR